MSPQRAEEARAGGAAVHVKVQTGDQNAKEQTSQTSEGSTTSSPTLLLAFAGAAVFVGLFIIFNTYSITVAQRIREFAMLRTLGASRRQVLRSVLIEAAVMGLVASMVGIGLGILFATGSTHCSRRPVRPAHGRDPGALPRRHALPLAVGLLSAALIASVALPIRATRVPPIAALREGFVLPPGRLSPHWALHRPAAVVLGGSADRLSRSEPAAAAAACC